MEVTAKTPRRLILAAAIAGLFATAVMPAFADTETLLDKLHEKGVLTDEEYQEMRTEARAETRAQALKEAQAGESKEKAREAFPTQTQGKSIGRY